MSKGKKNSSWWDNMLYIGIFVLALIFIYQLLKLWRAGVATAENFGSSVIQAAANTLSAIEAGFNTLVTAPGTFLSGIFSTIPSLFELVLSFVSGFSFTGAWNGLLSIWNSLFGVSYPIISSTGAATAGDGEPDDPLPSGNSLNPGTTFYAPQNL